MAIKVHKPSVLANRKATAKKTVFWDIKPDTTSRIRFLPPLNAAGVLFTKTASHFGFVNADDVGIAPACRLEHVADEDTCLLCDLVKFLYSTGDKGDEKIAKRIGAKPKWHAQAFCWDGMEYVGPYLVGLSKTTAEALLDIMEQQEQTDMPFFCDPDEGTDIAITRKGAQLQTKYSVNVAGKPSALDDIVPGWQDKVFENVMEKIEPRILSNDDLLALAIANYGDAVDWDEFNAWRNQ